MAESIKDLVDDNKIVSAKTSVGEPEMYRCFYENKNGTRLFEFSVPAMGLGADIVRVDPTDIVVLKHDSGVDKLSALYSSEPTIWWGFREARRFEGVSLPATIAFYRALRDAVGACDDLGEPIDAGTEEPVAEEAGGPFGRYCHFYMKGLDGLLAERCVTISEYVDSITGKVQPIKATWPSSDKIKSSSDNRKLAKLLLRVLSSAIGRMAEWKKEPLTTMPKVLIGID